MKQKGFYGGPLPVDHWLFPSSANGAGNLFFCIETTILFFANGL